MVKTERHNIKLVLKTQKRIFTIKYKKIYVDRYSQGCLAKWFTLWKNKNCFKWLLSDRYGRYIWRYVREFPESSLSQRICRFCVSVSKDRRETKDEYSSLKNLSYVDLSLK